MLCSRRPFRLLLVPVSRSGSAVRRSRGSPILAFSPGLGPEVTDLFAGFGRARLDDIGHEEISFDESFGHRAENSPYNGKPERSSEHSPDANQRTGTPSTKRICKHGHK